MRSTTTSRTFAAVAAAALLLTACGSDDTIADGDSADVGDIGEVADEAAEILEEEGVDTDGGPATATLDLDGETYEFVNEEPFGCFLSEDGGSMGAIDFTAELDDGTEFAVEWAGDTPELSSRLELTFPDGNSGWNLGFDGGFDTVEITDPNATVVGTVTRFGVDASGEQAEATVELSCP